MLPVVTDPLPSASDQGCKKDENTVLPEKPTEEVEERHSCNDIVNSQGSLTNNLSDEVSAHQGRADAHDATNHLSYQTLSDSLVNAVYEELKPCEGVLSSAPPLMISSALREIQYEYALPPCYSVDELKNFYSNPSADMISVLEDEFLEAS